MTRQLATAVAVYVGLLAQVAVRGLFSGPIPPNFLMLAAVAAAGGVASGTAWAAVAGLLCDVLTGRPLGVTMLAATLAATLGGRLGLFAPRPPLRRAAGVAAFVFVVEAAGRLLAFPTQSGGRTADLTAAAVTAALTGAAALTLILTVAAVREACVRRPVTAAATPG